MNIPRKIAALRSDLRRHEEEIERVAKLLAEGDENVLALPQFVEKYLCDIRMRVAELKTEIASLEAATESIGVISPLHSESLTTTQGIGPTAGFRVQPLSRCAHLAPTSQPSPEVAQPLQGGYRRQSYRF